MSAVRIHTKTLRVLAEIICGDRVDESGSISPYRTTEQLDEFFLEELLLQKPSTVAGTSRRREAEAWIKAFNETPTLLRILEAAVRPADYVKTDFSAAEVVVYLNEFLVHDNLRLIQLNNRYVASTITGVQLPPGLNPADILSNEYIRELSAKCDLRLSSEDYEGAITAGRTTLEAVLGELESRLSGRKGDHKGDFAKQFKIVARLLRMDDQRTDLDARFKDVARGLVMIANGLAPLRNKMSDGHARERKPAAHHARVIVNASKTVAAFLVESYLFQSNKSVGQGRSEQ